MSVIELAVQAGEALCLCAFSVSLFTLVKSDERWFVIRLSANTVLGSIRNVVFQELDSQKKKALQLECEKGNKNDLLEYLRSLDPEMVLNIEISLILILSLKIQSLTSRIIYIYIY